MRIALDIMGGDFAPTEISDGLKLFLDSDESTTFLLTGPQEILEAELKRIGAFGNPRVEIRHASQVVTMEDSPRESYKSKKDSSIRLAVMAVREKEADAFVTMGNTGASVFACQLMLGVLPGVKRPGLAIPFPTFGGSPCVMMDMGASVLPKSEHLVSFGVMAYCYSKTVFQIANPRVGLMNVGEEVAKGNDLTKEAFKMLSASNINFKGNAEGDDVFKGTFDVIICDGFTGNVLLKSCEQLAKSIFGTIKKEIKSNMISKLGAWLLSPVFNSLKQKTDPSELGGALLLGVNGICVIGHGKANALAVFNALRVAQKAIELNLNNQIVNELKVLTPTLVESSEESK